MIKLIKWGENMKKRVLLGMSGGVDSAVAAKLLIDQGYEVVAGFMRNWDSMANNDFLGNPDINNDICPQELDYEDALLVSQQLGIELVRIDFVEEYWKHVFTHFIEEYQKGRTPNPDLLCNKFIKFDYFLKYALDNNFDYIAMGHYAKVYHTNKGSYLMKAKDTNKDQTYFLAYLAQEQIAKALFPLADLNKSEVRTLANQYNLNVATKKDSTGICFIGERNFREFLKNYLPNQPGEIIDYDSKTVVGHHIGAMYYTIGQSKGLGIGGIANHEGGKWYVHGKDLKNKIIYVSNDQEQKYLICDQVLVKDINFNNEEFLNIKECHAKFRYRQQEYPVSLEWLNDHDAYVSGIQLPLAITPGQACVFYQDEYCLGGGVIDKIYLNGQELIYE